MHTQPSSTLRAMIQTSCASWRATAIVAAFGVLLSAVHVDAHALALGRLTTLSALGEPLRADIDIPEINAEEFASFKANLATPEAFKAAGMEYNPALASAQFTLQRRTNGTAYLQLRVDKAVSDPFVNLMITAKWSSGQIVRNYTLLLDPPAARPGDPAAATPITAPAMMVVPSVEPAVRAGAESKTAVATTQKPPATPVPKPSPKNSGEQLKVAKGDTAGKIAANHRPANVSLDQMLVAMLHKNPDAFIGNDVNRLKAGTVLSLPSSEEAQAIPDSVARQNMIAQSKDFNSFRRKLAENAPGIASKTPDRQASGKIEANVEERKSAAVTPDKLTLSKGNLNADTKAAAGARDNSEKIAKDRQAANDTARVAELSKNISDLNAIASTATVTPSSTAPTAAQTPVPTPDATAGNATAPTTAVTTPVNPVVSAKPALPATPIPEPGFLDDLMNSPATLPAAGGLLALLAAGGLYMARQRKNRAANKEDEDLNTELDDQSFFHTTSYAPASLPVIPAESVALAPSSEPAFTLPPLPIAPVAPATVPEMAPVGTVDTDLTQESEPADTFPAITASEFSARTVAQLHPESAKSPASVDLDLDFGFAVSDFQATPPTAAVHAVAEPVDTSDFEIASTTPSTTYLPEQSDAAAVVAAPNRSGMIEFDLDNLSLDLNASNNNQVSLANAVDDAGPLETKLALAQEFRAIGDAAGAKILAQEVIALASGSLKTKAENLLAEMG